MKTLLYAVQIIAGRTRAMDEKRLDSASYAGVYADRESNDKDLWLRSAGLK